MTDAGRRFQSLLLGSPPATSSALGAYVRSNGRERYGEF